MRRYLKKLIGHFELDEVQRKMIDYELQEARINTYFSKAHAYYLKAVKNDQVDYPIYKGVFLILCEAAETNGCVPHELNSRLAFFVVKHTLAEKEDIVRDYFENNPIGDYCKLLRLTLGNKYVGPNRKNCKGETEPRPALLTREIPMSVMEALTDFVNNNRLFLHKLSAGEMNDFLHGKKGICLSMTKNNLVAFLLYQLATHSVIKNEWASIIVVNGMLVSSTGNVITEAHNLTVSANKISHKPISSLKREERLVYEFVESKFG